MVITGAIVDASVTPTLRKPRGKKEYETVVEDRKETETKESSTTKLIEKVKPNVDTEARFPTPFIFLAAIVGFRMKQESVSDFREQLRQRALDDFRAGHGSVVLDVLVDLF